MSLQECGIGATGDITAEGTATEVLKSRKLLVGNYKQFSITGLVRVEVAGERDREVCRRCIYHRGPYVPKFGFYSTIETELLKGGKQGSFAF